MLDFIIGVITTTGFLLLINYTRKTGLVLKWWQWVLTVVEFLYIIFVLELISAFISEGALNGAIVMGLITGIIAVIGGVLLGRFVFINRH